MDQHLHDLLPPPDWRETTKLHVVQFSGGISSWVAAKRVQEQFGTSDMRLLIADTNMEDEDLWRFARDSSEQMGVGLTKVEDGRDPWQVFEHEGWLGNSHYAPCSKFLKQIPSRTWMEANADPGDSVVYIGLEWSEMLRVDGIRRGWAPYRVVFPMMDPPYRDKDWMLRLAFSKGIVPPRLYAKGFIHNNCGGACVKAGQAAWAHLLKMFPDRYLRAEANEEAFRAKRGDYTILTEQRGGEKRKLTLRELRRRIEAANAVGEQGELFDAYDALDWGGCGCMNEFEAY